MSSSQGPGSLRSICREGACALEQGSISINPQDPESQWGRNGTVGAGKCGPHYGNPRRAAEGRIAGPVLQFDRFGTGPSCTCETASGGPLNDGDGPITVETQWAGRGGADYEPYAPQPSRSVSVDSGW